MRKVFVVLAVLTLLVCMALPAFALGSGADTNTNYFYPVLSLDTIRYDGAGSMKYTMPYPFNSQVKTDWDANFEYSFDDGEMVYGASREFWVGSTPFIQGDLSSTLFSPSIGVTKSFRLMGGCQFVNFDVLSDNGFAIWFRPAVLRIDSVTIEIGAYDVVKRDGNIYYQANTSVYDFTLAATGATVDFDPAFTYFKEKVGTNIAFLQYVKIDVSFSRLDVDIGSFTFESKMEQNYYGSGSGSFSSWLGEENLTAEVLPPDFDDDMFGWLKNCVVAFMDFELIPGFSFSKIFVLILTIGVLLFFLHVVK